MTLVARIYNIYWTCLVETRYFNVETRLPVFQFHTEFCLFQFLGMNSIVIYICHEVFEDYFPLRISVPQTHIAHLAMDVWGMCFWLIVSAALYYKDIFIAI